MKNNKKGFTLAELLIVIAIIAILIAIAIPVFGAQLENARRQADHANLRSAYAEVQTINVLGAEDNIVGYTDPTSTPIVGATYCTDGKFHITATTAVKIQAASHAAGLSGCDECVVSHFGYKANTSGKDTITIKAGTGATDYNIDLAL